MLFRFNKFSVGGLLDVRQGGDAQIRTKGALHHFGTLKESQVNRDGGNFVFGTPTPVRIGPAAGPGAGMAVPLGEAWYTGGGSTFNGPTSQFVEDGGFVKLREISLGYTFDQPWATCLMGFSSMELRVACGWNWHTWTWTTPAWTRRRRCWGRPARSAASITSITRRAGRTCSHSLSTAKSSRERGIQP